MEPFTDRVLVIGLDGATWDVLLPLCERGVMPNLRALLGTAAYGTLDSTVPPITPPAWTTFMTGCPPAEHGILDFFHYDPAQRRLRINHSGRIRVPTLWHRLDAVGRSVVCINLPMTYPIAGVRGLIVSGLGAPDRDAALSHSESFHRRVLSEMPDFRIRTIWDNTIRDTTVLDRAVDQTCRTFQIRTRTARLADAEVPDWSILMVQFQEIDSLQHVVWSYLNVDHTGIDDPAWTTPLAECYRALDRSIGELLELAQRRGATVVMLSDHGFGPQLSKIRINAILAGAGLLEVPGVGRRAAHRVRQSLDRVGWWTRTRNRVGVDHRRMAGRHDPSARPHWGRTIAFSPHNTVAGLVYLNSHTRHGRRLDGRALGHDSPLKTPRQVDQALDETAGTLAGVRHPGTGEPIFSQVVRVAEAYRCDPVAEGFPDLIALPVEGGKISCQYRAGGPAIEEKRGIKGTHRPAGLLALAGSGVRSGPGLAARLEDVVPTILTWLGMSVPPALRGRVVAEAFHEAIAPETAGGDFGIGPEDRRIDDPARMPAPHFQYTEADEARIEQRLADLGYLD